MMAVITSSIAEHRIEKTRDELWIEHDDAHVAVTHAAWALRAEPWSTENREKLRVVKEQADSASKALGADPITDNMLARIFDD